MIIISSFAEIIVGIEVSITISPLFGEVPVSIPSNLIEVFAHGRSTFHKTSLQIFQNLAKARGISRIPRHATVL